MTFDGYGRLKTKHVPEQQVDPNNSASTDHTTWTYKNDDTINSVTEARGVIASFGYNNRHLVTGISYDTSQVPASANVAAASNVTFGYDPAGNRTLMTDGLGSVSYNYDQLSRLTSEARYFSPLGQSFTLSYDYNLGGELKKITDATNMTINYGYDSIGRLASVTGADNLYAGVSNYASNFQYRAWGGLKAMTDGQNHVVSLTYNSRLQPAQFDISGGIAHQNYDYNNDGRVRFVHNTTDVAFDRSYSYDHAARLTEARSGGAARRDNVSTPYNETFGYDPFSNLTARWSLSWSGQTNDSESATYANNRRSGWGYDADGRNTSIDTRTYNFDAVGQMKSMTAQQVFWNGNHVTVTENLDYDGDGARIKDVASERWFGQG